MTTIAIVGAGFSGTLLTLHLLRHCPPPTQLILIERNSQFGPRAQDRLATIEAARVVNCAGPAADYERISDPLIRSLLQSSGVRPDPLRLGLDVTANCALLSSDGALSGRLFAVGPITKGAFWEITAVPDIRRQTEKLAEYLSALVKTVPVKPA